MVRSFSDSVHSKGGRVRLEKLILRKLVFPKKVFSAKGLGRQVERSASIGVPESRVRQEDFRSDDSEGDEPPPLLMLDDPAEPVARKSVSGYSVQDVPESAGLDEGLEDYSVAGYVSQGRGPEDTEEEDDGQVYPVRGGLKDVFYITSITMENLYSETVMLSSEIAPSLKPGAVLCEMDVLEKCIENLLDR